MGAGWFALTGKGRATSSVTEITTSAGQSAVMHKHPLGFPPRVLFGKGEALTPSMLRPSHYTASAADLALAHRQ